MADTCEVCGRPIDNTLDFAPTVDTDTLCTRTTAWESSEDVSTCYRLGYERERARGAAAVVRVEEAERVLERHRHGQTIESDFICPDSLALTLAESDRAVLRAEAAAYRGALLLIVSPGPAETIAWIDRAALVASDALDQSRPGDDALLAATSTGYETSLAFARADHVHAFSTFSSPAEDYDARAKASRAKGVRR